MAKELQVTKQGGEQVTSSTKVELKRAIVDELSSLEIVMQMLYSRFDTMQGGCPSQRLAATLC